MATVFCVAYGSNLHPARMLERVPSAQVVGVVELPGYRLAFHKRSKLDGSGKGMLEESADALAYGILYEFDVAQKAELDRLEGRGYGYNEQQVRVPCNGIDYAAYIYMAASSHIDASLRPYHWYKHLVIAGAAYHRMPADYIAALSAQDSVDDPDAQRRTDNEALLVRIGWQA